MVVVVRVVEEERRKKFLAEDWIPRSQASLSSGTSRTRFLSLAARFVEGQRAS